LQTSTCGQMGTTLAVMCSVEIQLLLCRRNWSCLQKKSKSLLCVLGQAEFWHTRKWKQNRSHQNKNGAQAM